MSTRPDFLGLGAERAGTSWIYACLQEHPELCMPEKELHFFSRDRHWSKGFAWYESTFSRCNDDQLSGEFSTSYLSDPRTPGRIANYLDDVKLLVSLRNPVKRAYSSYKNDVAAGAIPQTTSFREAIQSHPKYIGMGRYATHLKRYRNHFDPGEMLVLPYESSRPNPREFIRSIYDFLEVEPSFEPTMIDRTVNVSQTPRLPGVSRYMNEISKRLRSTTLLRPLWWAAKVTGLGRFLRSLNDRGEPPEELDPEAREILRQKLAPEVQELRTMVDWTEDYWCDDFPTGSDETSNA